MVSHQLYPAQFAAEKMATLKKARGETDVFFNDGALPRKLDGLFHGKSHLETDDD